MEAIITFKDVSKTYESGTHALHHVSLHVEKGEFVFIVGPSGAGKSTLIKMLLREETPTKGTVLVNGYNLCTMKRRHIPAFRRTIGVVFQDFRLIPTMTVYENVAFALQVTNVSSKYIRRRVPYILDLLGLAKKARSYPPEISGGEQQRVAIARALINRPKILLADEPTGNLDNTNAWDIMKLMEEINNDGTTIVVVTHNLEIVSRMNKRVIQMNKGVIVDDRQAGSGCKRQCV